MAEEVNETTEIIADTGPTVTGQATPVDLAEGDVAIQKIAEEISGEEWFGDEAKKEYKGEEVGEGGPLDGEQVVGEEGETREKRKVTGEELGEQEPEAQGEHEPEPKAEEVKEEILEEEEEIEEEKPVDPTAPYNLSDSQEALKAPFSLRPDQLAEAEQLWAKYQDYTPAYSDIDEYVTSVELVYLLKCLLLMTYTPEQLQELIDYCVRPPHPDGHINFEQFIKIITIRQRDMPIEEELRLSLEVMDPEHTGIIDREFLRDVLTNHGFKMSSKMVDNMIKEVDISNDGTIGVEDVVGTLCIDLNKDDIELLQNQLNPPKEMDENIDNLI